jgi:hypothetical protein
MPLPGAVNVLVDIYRGFDALYPYPAAGQAPDVPGVSGYLRPEMSVGRFGYQTRFLYWTHVLYLPPGTDVRDPYSTQADPARDDTRADTICVPDFPRRGWCTTFVVVLVQRDRARGFLRVYLDRLQPRSGGCNLPAGNQTCCAKLTLPSTIHATVQNVSGCACLDGVTLSLTFSGPSFNNGWRYASSNTPGCGGVTDLLLYCRGAGVAGWVLSNTGAGDSWARSPSAGSKCSPFTLLFANFPFFYSACPSATVNVTVTQ